MKLLTHNMLTSAIIKNVKKGYPLAIEATEVKELETDFNPEFVTRMIPKLDWKVLCDAAESVGHLGEPLVSKELAPDYKDKEDFLKAAHHIMMEVEVKEGFLVCPETGRKFPISNGIPNMLLNEDEV